MKRGEENIAFIGESNLFWEKKKLMDIWKFYKIRMDMLLTFNLFRDKSQSSLTEETPMEGI